MVRSKANLARGIGLLIWLTFTTAVCGESWPPKRMPHCRPLFLKSSSRQRNTDVVQTASLQIADGVPEESVIAPESQPEELPQRLSVAVPLSLLPGQPSRGGPRLDEYVIESGDELEVKFRSTPGLNETVTVRPDGMISLQVVGDVVAADRTPEELRHFLMAAFQDTLKNPVIVVQLKRFATNDVFVGGEVVAPGRIPISGQMSVLQAIILAGGFRDTANEKRVIVRREGGFRRELNLKPEIKGRGAGQDMLLRPYDVVFVPKSPIAKVNLFVEQYIENVLPFSRNVGFFMNRELSTPNINP